jgi:hypothetical protein
LAHSFDALISRVSKTIIGFAADKGEDAMKIRVFLFCALLALVLPATARAQVTVDYYQDQVPAVSDRSSGPHKNNRDLVQRLLQRQER